MTRVIFTAFVVVALYILHRQRIARPASAGKNGVKSLIGKSMNAHLRMDPQGGRVFVEGENWNAVSEALVEVAAIGLVVTVKPK